MNGRKQQFEVPDCTTRGRTLSSESKKVRLE